MIAFLGDIGYVRVITGTGSREMSQAFTGGLSINSTGRTMVAIAKALQELEAREKRRHASDAAHRHLDS